MRARDKMHGLRLCIYIGACVSVSMSVSVWHLEGGLEVAHVGLTHGQVAQDLHPHTHTDTHTHTLHSHFSRKASARGCHTHTHTLSLSLSLSPSLVEPFTLPPSLLPSLSLYVCMYVCMYMQIHTHTHTTHVRQHIETQTYTGVCIHHTYIHDTYTTTSESAFVATMRITKK